ncbi:MAG TPA: polysaccharide biosynthesis protein [Micromonosporaceae bacterium]|nr:polysaccharide biosynthesis protein [Micromonosporaceae bacterium]
MNSSRGTDRLPQSAGQLGKAGAAVSVAAALANLLSYLVPLLGARTLDAENLGAIATVMAILAIASVPGMGLQMAIAVAHARHGGVPRLNRLIGLATATAVVPLLLLTPLLANALRLPWQAIPLTAAITGLVVAGSGWLGVLQGGMRFSALAVGIALLGVARCGGIVVGLLLRLDLLGQLMVGVVVAALAIAGVRLLLPATQATATPIPGLARAIWAAGSATLVLFILSYADLIAARHLLPAAASAEYAVLSVLTKGAIWAPQVISIVALPYFAREVRRTRWIAALGVIGVGAVLVTATVLFGQLALQLAGGPAYLHLAGFAPAFAAMGALYALVFVLTNAQVASGAKAPSAPLWAAAAAFGIVVLSLGQPSVKNIVTCAVVTAALSATALVAAMWITMRSTRATERA